MTKNVFNFGYGGHRYRGSGMIHDKTDLRKSSLRRRKYSYPRFIGIITQLCECVGDMRSIAICWKAQLILYLQRRRWEQSSADPRCGSSSVSRWCTCLSHKRLSRNHHTTKKTGCHARITGRIQPFCLSSRKFLSTSSSRRTTQRHRDDKRSFYPHHLCRWRQIILH